MLEIKDFSKHYHGQLALEIPELTLPPGVHWIQGSNGSGKTTLFRSLAGMIPFKGKITLNQKLEISKHPVEYRLRVNYGEAEPSYPDFLTGHDLIEFVGTAKKSDPNQRKELIERFDIGDFYKNPIGSYSSGMVKKISLILAFLGEPSLILLDEPLITIDKKAVGIMYQLVQDYHEKRGVSFLMSSHQDFQLSDLTVSNYYLVNEKKVRQIERA